MWEYILIMYFGKMKSVIIFIYLLINYGHFWLPTALPYYEKPLQSNIPYRLLFSIFNNQSSGNCWQTRIVAYRCLNIIVT